MVNNMPAGFARIQARVATQCDLRRCMRAELQEPSHGRAAECSHIALLCAFGWLFGCPAPDGTGQASRTGPAHPVRRVADQAVHHPALRIKAGGHPVEKTCVPLFVPAPHCPTDEAGELHQARRLRIDKQRRLCQIAEPVSARSARTELSCESPQGVFASGFVHHGKAPLRIISWR